MTCYYMIGWISNSDFFAEMGFWACPARRLLTPLELRKALPHSAKQKLATFAAAHEHAARKRSSLQSVSVSKGVLPKCLKRHTALLSAGANRVTPLPNKTLHPRITKCDWTMHEAREIQVAPFRRQTLCSSLVLLVFWTMHDSSIMSWNWSLFMSRGFYCDRSLRKEFHLIASKRAMIL